MRYESEASSGSSCVGGIFNSDDGTCVPLPPYALRSGPRDTIYWEPKDVRAAWHPPNPSATVRQGSSCWFQCHVWPKRYACQGLKFVGVASTPTGSRACAAAISPDQNFAADLACMLRR